MGKLVPPFENAFPSLLFKLAIGNTPDKLGTSNDHELGDVRCVRFFDFLRTRNALRDLL